MYQKLIWLFVIILYFLLHLKKICEIPKYTPSPNYNHSSCVSQHPVKIGSFQEFKENDGNVEDIGSSNFPVEEVHKIAAFDIRVFNSDRHYGNILYREDTDVETGETVFHLIPIDHGYILPNNLLEASFCWQNWSQVKKPMSERTKSYISKLDAEKDIELLKSKFLSGLREEHFEILRISTALLKKGAENDVTFSTLADMICRPSLDQPSILEELVQQSKSQASPSQPYFEIYLKLLDKHFFENSMIEFLNC